MSARINSLVCCVCLEANSDVTKLSLVEENGLKADVLEAVCGVENLFASLNNVFLICSDCLQHVQQAITLKGRALNSQKQREFLTAEKKKHFMSQMHLQPKVRDYIEVQDVIKSPAEPKKPKKKSSSKDRKSFICQLCKKKLSSKLGLSNHIENIHNKSVRFFCDNCGKGFWLKSTLTRHVRTHNKATSVVRESLPSPIWKCWKKLCGEIFENPKALSNHYFNHYNSNGREFVCDCSAMFNKMSNLRRHIARVHVKAEI